jgi:DNA-binding transcriptional LysR family regulator
MRSGMGWSVIPDYLVRDHLATGELGKLDDATSELQHLLYLISSRSALRHPRIRYTRDFLLKCAAARESGLALLS